MLVKDSWSPDKIFMVGGGLLLCLLVLSAYSNSLYAPFVLDDLHSFVKEPRVLNFTFNIAGLENLAGSKFGIRRFLPMLTFALDLKWGGGSLFAFHVTNIVVHLLATLTLLFLVRSLLLLPKVQSILGFDQTTSAFLAFTVVGLWSLNPVQTNAVTYIVQRMTSMAALFYFLSLACYVRARIGQINDHRITGKSTIFYFLSFLFFTCAMMSKENSATLPAIVFLVEWLLVEESGLFPLLKRRRNLVVAVFLLAVGLIIYKLSHGWLLGGYSRRHFNLPERLLTELRIVASYCFLLLLPLPRWLNLEHDVSLSTSLFSPLSTFFSLVFIVLVVFSAWRSRKKFPLIAFGIFWFFINLLIESSFIPLELEFEHRLYLPSAGFYLVLILILAKFYTCLNGNQSITADRLKIFVSIVVIVCSGLSFLTYTRNMVWNDSVTLWRDCIAKAPAKARPYSNLSTALLQKGEYQKAEEAAEKAIRIGVKGYEEYWVAASNIVASLSRKGEYEKAVARGEQLLKDAPAHAKKNSYPAFLYNLGRAYLDKSDFQTAYDYFLKGYKICFRNDLPESTSFERALVKTLRDGLSQGYDFDPGMNLAEDDPACAEEKMAQIFFGLQNYGQALRYVEKAQRKNHQSVVAEKIKEEIRRIKESNREQKEFGTLKEKYFYHPFADRFHFYMALSFVMEKYDLPGEAFLRYCLQRAAELRGDSPDVYIVTSWYFYRRGNYHKALEIIDQGIALNPEYAQLWVNRGIYALAKRDPEAYPDFTRALSLYPGNPHRLKILKMQSLAEELVKSEISVN